MTVTAASFRVAFPAFANPVKFPAGMVDLWLSTAVKLINAAKWGDLADLGAQLMAAHYLALEAQAVNSATGARMPGASVGVLSSKSAQGVSASYDVSTATEKDAGHWNMTTYGTRYIRLARMMGAGPVQVGVPGTEDSENSIAWPGVTLPPW
jgi:hypothetical protein